VNWPKNEKKNALTLRRANETAGNVGLKMLAQSAQIDSTPYQAMATTFLTKLTQLRKEIAANDKFKVLTGIRWHFAIF
jgi:hypothetical protein